MSTKQRLTAKRVRELLALKKVHNDYVLVGDTAGKIPYVTYRNGVAKQNIAAAWQVMTPGRSTDAFEGRPITVRFTWSGIDTPEPRWEQAFSDDGGRTWETNWIMQFTCAEDGR